MEEKLPGVVAAGAPNALANGSLKPSVAGLAAGAPKADPNGSLSPNASTVFWLEKAST